MIATRVEPATSSGLVWILWNRRLCNTDLHSVQKIVYLSVSITNACHYCLHSHTAAAKPRDMTNPEHVELLRIVMTTRRSNPSRFADDRGAP